MDIIKPPHAAANIGISGFKRRRVTIETTLDSDTADGGNALNEEQWHAVPFGKRQRKARAATAGAPECWGCAYGCPDPTADAQPTLRALWDLFASNYGREMSNYQLAVLMHEFFEQEIRQPMLAQGKVCPEWSVRQIVEHIADHMIEPVVHSGIQLQRLKEIERVLMSQIKMENDITGDEKIDLKVLDALLKVQKQQQLYFNSKCTRQLFYSDTLDLDKRRANQDR